MPVDAHMEASQEMCRSALMRVHLEALMRVASPLENVVKQRGEEQVLGRRSGSLPAVQGTLAAGRSAWDRTPASAPRGFLQEPRSSTGVGAERTRVVRREAVGRSQSRERSHVVFECLFSFACLRLLLKSYLNTYMPR